MFFVDSAILVSFKVGEKVFDDPGVDPIPGVDGPYGLSVNH